MSEQDLLKVYNLLQRYKEGERNFVGIDLSEVNLSRINLSQTNLTDACFSVANLSLANLSGANLSRANLNVTRLSSANLTGAILNAATLNVANLARADLTDANLIAALIIRSELIRANLSRANFTEANLNSADLREAQIEGASFKAANLSGANLRGAWGKSANFERADMRRANLVKADLPMANLNGTELRQANLTYANLPGANLSQVNLRWADLRGANLAGANLSRANLSGANLAGANLSQVNLEKASLVHTDLTQTNLIRATWMEADISGATLTGAKLHGVPRFNLKAEDITCEWVDLSPEGDRTKVYQFTSESLKRFFNQALPTVQILIDSSLDLMGNVMLANSYHKIAQAYPGLNSPPSIEINSNRTTLTFRVQDESLLLPIACLAVFPFEEAKKLQKLIIHLIRQLQDKLDKSNPKQMSILTEMNAVVQVLNQFKGEIRTSRSQADSAFLRDQVQMNLKNSSQKLLSLQGLHESKPTETADDLPAIDPDISGDISMFSQMDTAQVSPQANPKTPAIDSPSPQQLLSFIQGFDYLS